MTEVRVRNVESWVVEWHRQQAKLNGKSLEGELRDVLTQAALAKKQALADEFRSLRDELRQKHGSFSDSAASIREDRESRG
jgi:plasmid stability protein